MLTSSVRAWNNFVLRRDPHSFAQGSSQRAAAFAILFFGYAENGGLNHFLDATYDFDAQEFVEALRSLGAHKAANQLEEILAGLGTPLSPTSQNERSNVLMEHWNDGLDRLETLSSEAEDEMMSILQNHVSENEALYLDLPAK